MKYRLVNNDLYYDGKVVDSFPSKGEAYATFNHIQTAYADGQKAEQDNQARLKGIVRESRRKTNLRSLLKVLAFFLVVAFFVVLMPLGMLELLTAIIVGSVLYLISYGLGRIDRVTF